MSVKLILYCIFIPFSIWIITSVNIYKYFKKNSIMQIHCFYIFLSVCMSYLIVNFLMDIFYISNTF